MMGGLKISERNPCSPFLQFFAKNVFIITITTFIITIITLLNNDNPLVEQISTVVKCTGVNHHRIQTISTIPIQTLPPLLLCLQTMAL